MNFNLYFKLGVEHITDLNGYDHILFIIAICATYTLKDWKAITILITAFTIGHSVALALAVLNIIPIYPPLIEFLIPVTILFSCIHNLLQPPQINVSSNTIKKSNIVVYFSILIFGIIHGLGFSNFLRETLIANENIFTPLLAFNIGLEIGQLLIVFFIFLVNYFFITILNKKLYDWNLFVSGSVTSLTFIILIEKSQELFSNLSF